MRSVLWLLGLFAAAVALALFAMNNHGTVTIFLSPYRVLLSLNLAIVIVLAAIVLVTLILRTISAAAQLPARARRWRAQQSERAVHALLLESIVQLCAGRYTRSRKAAQSALDRCAGLNRADAPAHLASLLPLAHLLVAESAHALQDQPLSETHLDAALATTGQAGEQAAALREGILLRASRFALQQRDPQGALARLSQLPSGAMRRTGALRLKLQATQQSGECIQALETARLLAKHGAFSALAAASLIRGLALDCIASARDPHQLEASWKTLSNAERATKEIALRAAQRLMDLGGQGAMARSWLHPMIETLLLRPLDLEAQLRARLCSVIDSSFGPVIPAQPLADSAWLSRIEAAQTANPRDAYLQLLAGMTCLRMGLWGKAKAILTQAAGSLAGQGEGDALELEGENARLLRKAWCALAQLAEHDGDEAGAAAAWREAGQIPV